MVDEENNNTGESNRLGHLSKVEGDAYDLERDRGFLTVAERKYIMKLYMDSGQTYEGQQERNIRYRIRQHAIDGLLDAVLLNAWPNTGELNQIAKKERFKQSNVPAKLVQLAYKLIVQEQGSKGHIDELETAITEAVRTYHPYQDHPTFNKIVSTEIEVDEFDLDDREQRIKTGDATPNEMLEYYKLSQQEVPELIDSNSPQREYDEEAISVVESNLSKIKSLADPDDA